MSWISRHCELTANANLGRSLYHCPSDKPVVAEVMEDYDIAVIERVMMVDPI
jgi:hypothetical protein